MELRQKITYYLETATLFLWGIVLLVLPLLYTVFTTDQFTLPKQLLIGAASLLSLIFWGVKMVMDKQVKIRRTPLDIALLIFGGALLLSSSFANNKADSFAGVFPVVFLIFSYFSIVNVVRRKHAPFFLMLCLFVGGALTAVLRIFSFSKIYILPFASSHVSGFSSFGSSFDELTYLGLLFVFVVSLLLPVVKKKIDGRAIACGVLGLFLLAGIIGSGRLVTTTQKPVFLPFGVGFQTAFASISQDNGRVAQSFFFGSGFGTYSTVFTKFRPASFNANQNWYLNFSQSSSFVLELLATTGLIGILAYFFLLFRIVMPVRQKVHNPAYIPLLGLILISFILPLSFVSLTLLFALLVLFTLQDAAIRTHNYFDLELKFVALKKGIFNFVSPSTNVRENNITPIFALALLLAIVLVVGFYSVSFAVSDVIFQRSLVATQANNGIKTYDDQKLAISIFPYRSAYYRIFSQTNLSLSNSLLALAKGKPTSQQIQQTAYTLIQQGITTSRQATQIAPDNVLEWQNLSAIYRTLIGVGQNAETFAAQANQQAILLDPANPQEYVSLGGLYYQLGQFDNAIKEFQAAINLKSDYANAYYNLGHSYQQKGDLQNALATYQVVRQLVANDKTNAGKIDSEIQDLQTQIGTQGNTPAKKVGNATTPQQPLEVPSSQQLPPQPTQIPLVTPTPTQ